jgi:two-component system alkaline phosphatase synthesis response regulator PhoP
MLVDNTKVLVCSDNAQFLREFESDLRRDFDLQIAGTIEMALFLLREWEPLVVIVDADGKLEPLLVDLRRLQWTQFFGIVGVTRDRNLRKDERLFQFQIDQVVVMPISYSQLKLRLESTARRMNEISILVSGAQRATEILSVQSQIIEIGPIRIYPQDYLIKYRDANLTVTPTQFKLLIAFVTNADQLLSRSWIKEKVWGNAEISPRSIDAQISKLKKMLPELDRFIVNVYGKGYIFTRPNRSDAA